MALTTTAPYASPEVVIRVLERFRESGFAGQPITTSAVQKLGIGTEVARRAVLALKLLELISDDGAPQAPLVAFKNAPSDKYLQVLADQLLAMYEGIFAFTGRDISDKTPQQLEDAFREFDQPSLRNRMVSCFVGLCTYSGLVTGAKTKPGPRIATSAKPRGELSRATRSSAASRRHTPSQGNDLVTQADLPSGGVVRLTVSADLVGLTGAEREFVFGLIDKVKEYGKRPALGRGSDSESEGS
jgi:hypothetical protein